MKRTAILMWAIVCTLALWAQSQKIEVKSHVLDAQTGDVLPFVHIYETKGNGTLSNMEGDFTIKTDAKALLRLSFVGYETLTIQADRVPEKIRMKPMSKALGEVKVVAWESILMKAGRKLNREFDRKRKKTSRYFYRMTTAYRKKTLVEAFMEARAAVNIRDIRILKGRHGRMTQEGLSDPFIANMNFHHPLELSMEVRDVRFWRGLLTPFNPTNNMSFLIREYNIQAEELSDSQGNSIYKYQLSRNSDSRSKNSILTGTLYIDAKTLEVLKFEGQVERMYLDIYKDFFKETTSLLLDVTVNYTHKRGYTEVQSVSYKMSNGDMSSTAILYNVDDMKLGLESKKTKSTAENMLSSIDDAGFDNILWEHSNIVQRTKEEEMLAGLPDQTIMVNDSIEKEPETPTEKLLDHLKRFGRNLPQEKVYVHMDNTCYFVGDTIWFSAYSTQTNDSKPSQISGVLYVELYNQEGYLMERKLVEMTHGRGYGNFIIDKEAYAGYYELRAYTRWQLNWGMFQRKHSRICRNWFFSKELEYNYFRDYDKLYSRVFPVYDMPETEGDYSTLMTRKKMRRRFKRDPHERKRTLTLYPEGGQLVEGLPCRVAFEATWDDGQELEGALLDAQAENRGRGTFEITPTAGEKRELVFTTTDGSKVTAQLPEVAESGVALRVDVETDSVDLIVRRTHDLQSDCMGLTIMHEGVLQTYFNLNGREQHFRVAKRDLKVGVNQATVFDEQGRVWADRLFFVKDSLTKRSNISISGVKNVYEPYEAITLTLKAPTREGGNMSIAVRDASHRDVLYDNASLQTEMLLTSEIKGFVPNPEFYFEKNDYAHNRALDLLMLTQGWRRFKWEEMAVKNVWQLTQVPERTPVITGKVYKTSDEMFAALLSGWSADDNSDIEEIERETETGRQDNHWQGNVNELLTSKSSKTKELTDIEYYPGDNYGPFKNKAMRVHAEVVLPDNKRYAAIDLDTKDGYFKVQMPRYYGNCFFFLSAADTLKWKGKKYEWIQLMSEKNITYSPKLKKFKGWPADYHVRVNFPYPRFVNPYNYYQTHLNYSYDPLLSPQILKDGSLQIDEVTVWSKHNTLRKMEDSIPALIVDAYEAYNATIDAGLGMGTHDIVRTYVADYGLDRPWVVNPNEQRDYKIKERYGYDVTRRGINDVTTNRDSAYLHSNLHSFARGDYYLSDAAIEAYHDYTHLDKYVLYTDFEPRLWGNERYYGSDLPETQIAIYPFPDDSRRLFYRDRRYILAGFSFVHEFYHPDYTNRKLDEQPEDYRRTLYWNPFLPFDANGVAKIRFYNNSSMHTISIDAQGFSSDGAPLTGYE